VVIVKQYPGDNIVFIGYHDSLESAIIDSTSKNKIYTFQFAINIPCLGIPKLEYEGHLYNTIQIFSQCWFKENLNVGKRISNYEDMKDNSIIEKYCYNDSSKNCEIYGGLYQWDEMMNYTMQESSQGICPPGWHIPSNDEWRILAGTVDQQYGIEHPIWNDWMYDIGFNVGRNLKTKTGWNYDGDGVDYFGFSALPSGYRSVPSGFFGIGSFAYYWSSTRDIDKWSKSVCIKGLTPKIHRGHDRNKMGYSVRCIKDN
jgi:uncharacterized protein (TIGR02145 family)